MQSDTNNTLSYGFWIWSIKLDAVLSMLCHLIDYEIDDVEREIIKADLRHTNDEKEIWTEYELLGKNHKMELKLAFDAEEEKDMIHIRINTHENLKCKIEALDLFQSMFSKLEK